MICIVDYGAGNVLSVKNMLKKVGANDVMISSNPTDIIDADKLILPGVGRFDFGMQRLIDSGLIDVLTEKVMVKKAPILGICLGAQLITQGSEEGLLSGLNWVPGKTVAFKNRIESSFKIPHMGWNSVTNMNESPLYHDMPENSRFYFVHSYYLEMADPKHVVLTANYGKEFCAAYQMDNIYACQFHPEKSHKYGMKLMENFVNLL